MKKFRLTADCTFDAEDIDDAMIRLGTHFAESDRDHEMQGFRGEINIGPVEEATGSATISLEAHGVTEILKKV